MARETKIGVALMVLLLGVFGAVAYKKWDALKSAVVAKTDKDESKPEEKPVPKSATSQDDLQPDSNPFATVDAAPAPPNGQDEPASPFADTTVTTVPVREVSASATEGLGDATPPAQAEPFTAQSANAEGQPVAARQDEPSGQTANASSEFAGAATATTDAASPAADNSPFADAAATPVADTAAAGAGQSLVDDPFSAAGEATTPSEPATAATTASTADASDPFSGAGEASAAAAGETADPFAGASDATLADSNSEPTPAESQPATLSDDPFSETTIRAGTADTAEAAAAEPRPEPGVFADTTEPSTAAAPETAPFEPQPDATFASSSDQPAVQPAPPAGRTDYCIVGEKDTYWSISQKAYGTNAYFQALAEYNKNRIRDPKRLRPGMTVLTPAAEELEARYPKLIARGAAAPADGGGRPGFLVNEAGRPAYRVGDGDTLSKIAQAHLGRGSRWVQIYEMNRDLIPNPKVLKPGTVLQLPGDASRVRIASGR
jgi:nucleoid-associated protein YgaU